MRKRKRAHINIITYKKIISSDKCRKSRTRNWKKEEKKNYLILLLWQNNFLFFLDFSSWVQN